MTDLLILSGSSIQFLEVPQKGFLKIFVGIFLPHFFDTFLVLLDTVKNFFKSPGSPHECGLHFVYIDFLSFIQKGGFGGPKFHHHESLAVFGHFGHQNS